MIVLHFSMQGEDSIEHTSGKRHLYTFLVCKRKIFLSILMPNVICVHFGQLIDHCAIAPSITTQLFRHKNLFCHATNFDKL
jgi:hypothetical protein